MRTLPTLRRAMLLALLTIGAAGLHRAAAQMATNDPAWIIGNELVRFPQGPGATVTTSPLPTSYHPDIPDAYEYQGQVAQHTQNVQYDAEGNVLFFIVDHRIYNGDGLLIADGATGPADRDCEVCFYGGEEVHIIPVAGSCTRYHVIGLYFHNDVGVAAAQYRAKLRWGVLDLSLKSDLPVYSAACEVGVNGRFLTLYDLADAGFSLSGDLFWEEHEVHPDHAPTDEDGYLLAGTIDIDLQDGEALYASSVQLDPEGRHLMVVRYNQGLVMLQVDDTGIIKLPVVPGHYRWPYGSILDHDISQRGEIALHWDGDDRLKVGLTSYVKDSFPAIASYFPGYGILAHQTRVSFWEFAVGTGQGPVTITSVQAAPGAPPNPRAYSLDLYPVDYPPPVDGMGNPITRPAVCGLEFAPNGRYLYFVKSPDRAYPNSGGPESNFGYIDLDWQWGVPGSYHAFLPIDVPAETRKLADTQMGINVGPDGTGKALYVIGAEADGYWLGAFLDPDNPDPANWQPAVVDLPAVAYRTEQNSPLTRFKLVNRRIASSTHAALLATQACCKDLVLARDRSAVITAEDCDLTWEPGDNAFWNTSAPIYVATELRIAAGAHVTANGMEFHFGPDAELVIESGASFQCNNCVFTNACEERWKGIRVEGTSANPVQTPTHQGYLRLNNSTLENAITGVWCARVNEQGQAVMGHFGGFVRAFNSTFRDCITGVQVERYQRTSPTGAILPNLSAFSSCTFETTAAWPGGTPYAHANLADVRGIKFNLCKFTNHIPHQFPALNRGWGILAVLAGFDVEGSTVQDASLFKDLSIGVVAVTGTLRKANVRRSWFRGNVVGAYMQGCTAPEISRSHFYVPASATPALTTAGLTLHQSTAYLVEENIFNDAGPAMVEGNLGIHIIGDVRAENRIYNNAFHGLNAGTFTVGRHKGNTPQTEFLGLQLLCSDYTDCILDYVLGANTYIKAAQGYYGGEEDPQTQLAANRFFPGIINGITISNMQPSGNNAPFFNYLRHNVSECDPLNQSDHYSDIEIVSEGQFEKTEACGKGYLPEVGGGGTGVPGYLLAAAQLQSAQAYFTGTVDTGEREDIIEAIGQDNPWLPSHTLRDYLLARCPLSDAVLLRVIARAEPLDPWHLTQVLLGNARLTPQVLRAVEHSGLLNEYMLAIVRNAGSGPTVKDLLRQEVELRAMQKAEAQVLAFDAIASDSLLVAPYDSLYAMIAAHPDPTDYYLLASIAQERGQYTLATAWLDSLQTAGDDGHGMLRDLYAMDQALGGDWTQADAGQRAQLANMATTYEPGAAMAWAIRYHLGETFEVPFADLPDGSKRLTWTPDKAPRPSARPLLEAHPNPTSGQSWVVIGMEVDDEALLRVSDPQGRLIRTHKLAPGQRLLEVDLSGLANGLYTCELLQGEYKLGVVKLPVQR